VKKRRYYKESNERWRRENKQHVDTYTVWNGMIQRCYNTTYKVFPYYGGRGILVCQRWRKSFVAFVEDMGYRPLRMEIDRIDNSKGYEPGNCHWVSKKENCRNRRTNHFLTAFGRTLTIVAWAEETGISAKLIGVRVRELGWTVERALSVPVNKNKAHKRKNAS
jgi:hypothetical protein